MGRIHGSLFKSTIYGKILMLPAEWLQKQGHGATVGVCDTGLKTTLSCFKNRKITYKPFGATSPRHGTLIASTIFEIAPEAEMVFAGGIMDSYACLERMLDWISNFKLDILNLSLAFPEKEERILSILNKIHSSGAIIVCAYAEKLPFPWSGTGFLSAGKGGDFEAPDEWTAYSSTGYKTMMRGSSASAAITSGLCSLGKAIIPAIKKEDFLSIVSPEDIPVYEYPKKQKNIRL